jgi:hypothetical protein
MSKIEEEFRVYLSLRIGTNNETTSKLWGEEAMRTLRHKPRLRNKILRSTKTFSFETPAGIFLAERIASYWPPEVHNPVIEKMIRGFYFHHYGEALGNRVQIKVQWLRAVDDLENWSRRIDPSLEPLWTELPGTGSVGAGYFRYSFGATSPLDSIWMFDFYGAHFAGGYTTPTVRRDSGTPE